ncbi:MAG: hypothetical protein N4A49_15130 [Marinifilaceae bacterium]|nr:hypothetical protein [Marinifilaceae bacterium]
MWKICIKIGEKIFGELKNKYKFLYLRQFTDKNSSSTLSKFLDDCDDDFIKLLDEDSKYLECFLSHKSGNNWEINQFDEFAESILPNNTLIVEYV